MALESVWPGHDATALPEDQLITYYTINNRKQAVTLCTEILCSKRCCGKVFDPISVEQITFKNEPDKMMECLLIYCTITPESDMTYDGISVTYCYLRVLSDLDFACFGLNQGLILSESCIIA